MKTDFMTASIVAALLLMGNFAANAGPNQQLKKNTRERVRQEIAQNITCPGFIEENSPLNQVKAVVQVDDAGQVKVIDINSANQQLKEYVIGELQNMKIKKPGESQKFVLVINFAVDE